MEDQGLALRETVQVGVEKFNISKPFFQPKLARFY
jgi:hypothetical protein